MIKNNITHLLVFALFFLFFLTFHLITPNILGVDSYFYLKKSFLIPETGLLTRLPWLQYSYLANNASGLHFTFPYLLFPFLKLFNHPVGGKILISLLNGLLFFIFYSLLYKSKISKPFLWTVLFLLSSHSLLFRINLIRPLSISTIIFLLLLYFLLNKKYLLFGIFCFFYSWLYDGFLIFALPVLTFTIIKTAVDRKIPIKLLTIYLSSTFFSLIINPLFPNNIYYLFISNLIIVKTSFNKHLADSVEWNHYSMIDFISENIVLTLIIVFLIVLLVFSKLNRPNNNLSAENKIIINVLALTTISLLVLTIISKHFIEYLVPVTLLFAAYAFTLFQRLSKSPELQTLIDNLNNYFKKTVLKTIIILAVISLAFLSLKSLYTDFKQAYPINRYKETAEWLQNNTPEKSIIFHSSWDAFPRLFFYNHHNYYIVGLHPTFMYLYNHNLYWLWRNITEKSIACTTPTNDINLDSLTSSHCSENQQTPAMIAATIKTQFNSEYIWVDDYPLYQNFKKFLEDNQEYFEKMIETDDSSVFWIK